MNSFLLDHPEFNSIRYQVYADLRQKEPIYWYEPMKTWLVMRYADITSLLKSNLLSTDYLIKDKLNNMGNDINESVSAITDIIKKWMIYNEPPAHTRLRKFMNKAFDRSYIDNVMPKIMKIVQSKIDEIDLSKEVDFVKNFAHPVPAAILSEMIGLDEINLNTFIAWSDSIANFMQDFVVSPTPNVQIAIETAKGLLEMKNAFINSIEIRKTKPKTDLLSHLVSSLVHESEHPITEEELVLQLIHLIFGGHKIPQFVMSNLMHCMILHGSKFNGFEKSPENLMGAINEVMRFESPIQFITRHAKEDFSIHGKNIQAGDSIYLMLGSANRDETIFQHSEEFDILRPGNKHLSFGSGIHVCIGTALVRDELKAIFTHFYSNFKNIEPLYELNAPSWTKNATFHGVEVQPIKLVNSVTHHNQNKDLTCETNP